MILQDAKSARQIISRC